MSFKTINNVKILGVAFALLMTGGINTAFAADEKPVHWLKRCVTDSKSIRTCLVTEAIILENKEKKIRIQLASIRIQTVSSSKSRTMFIQVPNRILLQPGLRFQVDQGKTRVAPFSICYEKACESEVDLSTDFINQLKKGNQVTLSFLQFDGKPVTIKVPLAGFTVGYNSKGVELTPEQAGLVVPAAKPAKDDTPKPLPE
ncbi:MAG: hypothetical protein COB24_01830 [Hyphomicrobiales bacterium]|nr:MAG: hypothetical protein COB24_01830 [Hyphomicrobiales bacterium]